MLIAWFAGTIFAIIQGLLIVSSLSLRSRVDTSSVGLGLSAFAPGAVPAGCTLPNTSVSAPRHSLLKDYLSLTKPRVLSLLLLTTLVAMVLAAEGTLPLSLVFWTMLGGYLAAGGSGAINCALDHDIDRQMHRTSKRPVPAGRISQRRAWWFGIILVALSFVVLATFTTLAAALLAMAGAVYYVLVYTCWLKRRTWRGVVIGGGAGAIPPLVGWAAVTGSLALPALLLAVVIFYWTPIHFWTLALLKKDEYAQACLPMLPVVMGERETRWQMLLYAILLVTLSLLLPPLGVTGPLYLPPTLLLGLIFLHYAWKVWRSPERALVWQFYSYSLVYLALLFSSMVLGHVLRAG